MLLVACRLQHAPLPKSLETRERTIEYYLLSTGPSAPFGAWRDSFADVPTKAAISARIARLRGGNFSDSKPIGHGASESRIDFGPGYRIYYGVDGDKIILLCGGDKSTQSADIPRALGYWTDYKERKKKRNDVERKKLQRRSSRRSPK
jgi:putative addiction module killer protein